MNGLIGESQAMRRVFNLIRQFAGLDTHVLITGDIGTGKGVIARALHAAGPVRARPFTRLHCASLTLMENESMEVVPPPKTIPDKGTLFLEEVADLSMPAQLRLLTLLEYLEGRGRNGEAVRVISASRANLVAMVRNGDFREDLHYRLNGLTIAVPPLRNRREDIPLLTRHFLEQAAARTGGPVKGVSGAVADIFQRHHWPGNVRQLENILCHAAAVSEEEVIQTVHLPPGFPGRRTSLFGMGVEGAEDNGGNSESASITRQDILTSLRETRWNRSRAAQRLGIARSTFYRKMDELGVS